MNLENIKNVEQLNTYSHVLEDVKYDAIAILQKVFDSDALCTIFNDTIRFYMLNCYVNRIVKCTIEAGNQLK